MRKEHQVPAAILCKCLAVKKGSFRHVTCPFGHPLCRYFRGICTGWCQTQTGSAASDPQKSLCDPTGSPTPATCLGTISAIAPCAAALTASGIDSAGNTPFLRSVR